MTQAATTSTTLINRYVTALLAAAQEHGQLTALSTGARDLIAMVEGSADLQNVLASPLFSIPQQQRALAALMTAARVDPVLQGFVRVVLKNRRGASLVTFLRAMQDELLRRDGQVVADIDVAAPLNDLQQRKLVDMLGKWTGRRVQLKITVSPAVLGGIKIRLGSIQIDDSIAGKLNRLRQDLLGASASA